jgi:hypothetical protein
MGWASWLGITHSVFAPWFVQFRSLSLDNDAWNKQTGIDSGSLERIYDRAANNRKFADELIVREEQEKHFWVFYTYQLRNWEVPMYIFSFRSIERATRESEKHGDWYVFTPGIIQVGIGLALSFAVCILGFKTRATPRGESA